METKLWVIGGIIFYIVLDWYVRRYLDRKFGP